MQPVEVQGGFCPLNQVINGLLDSPKPQLSREELVLPLPLAPPLLPCCEGSLPELFWGPNLAGTR